MADPKPGNSERGWNDPPVFSFGSSNAPPTSSQSSPRKTLLNKRVAFPLSGLTNPSQPASSGDGSLLAPQTTPALPGGVQILPPALDTTTPLPVPLVVPNMIPASPPVSPMLGDDTLTEPIDRCMERLGCAADVDFLILVESQLQSTFTRCKGCIKQRSSEEIRRKMVLFRECWEQGKLSDPVKVKMSYLAIALTKNRFDIAFDIHLGLMVDYTAEVNNWMVGVKRLIHESKLKFESQNKDGIANKRSGEDSQENPLSEYQGETHIDKKAKFEDSVVNNS